MASLSARSGALAGHDVGRPETDEALISAWSACERIKQYGTLRGRGVRARGRCVHEAAPRRVRVLKLWAILRHAF